eukprot:CAMPEP_0118637968 /NCGR_PEP_ID=MMETSP0785-20121206/3434_1 /TAXON_ID=91992 /ORGANISM="Bolidomonas pacifica, Strain CCMP 1866" /LENGTH=64 /DNA_ID=CAMNT_0006529187 /DNA_START=203 /DNA_END=397 /DNA_ORIENTATION=+
MIEMFRLMPGESVSTECHIPAGKYMKSPGFIVIVEEGVGGGENSNDGVESLAAFICPSTASLAL